MSLSSAWCDTNKEMLNYVKGVLPAQSVLDQRHKDVREHCMEWVAAKTSLVPVCDAGNIEKLIVKTLFVANWQLGLQQYKTYAKMSTMV